MPADRPPPTVDKRSFTTPWGRRLMFTQLGFGSAPLGNMHRALSEEEASATVEAAWASGARYFDTAPLYGHGLSEIRIGRVLAARDRDDFVLSTKVGRLLEPCDPGDEGAGIYRQTPQLRVRFDYSREGVLRSLEASLKRLDLQRIDILYVHDLEPGAHGSPEAYEARWRELVGQGGWRAADDLRASGVVSAIGLGVNDAAPCERMLAELDPDLFLLAGRYTLLEQAPLHQLLAVCLRRGVGVLVGGPFNSGVLAQAGGTYNYAKSPPEVLRRVKALRAVCERHGVPLRAAALQFPLAHPAVVSVIAGGQTPTEACDNALRMAQPIPAVFWDDLKRERLLDPDAPTPTEVVTAC